MAVDDAGDHPQNWRATIPMTGETGQTSIAAGHSVACVVAWDLIVPPTTFGNAGDHPQNWRATIPTTGVTRQTTLRQT